MKTAVVNGSLCDQSPFCPVKRVCPVQAVTQDVKFLIKADTPVINKDLCIGCGKCVQVCPMKAVKMVKKK